MKLSKFSDRLRFIDVGISVFEDTHLKEKHAEIRKGTMKKYILISSDIWLLIPSCYLQGLLHPHGYFDNLYNPLQFQRKCLPLRLSFLCHIIYIFFFSSLSCV